MAEILLLSDSTACGRAFLEHAHGAIAEVLQGRDRLLFIALAASDPDRYTRVMRESLAPIGIRLDTADAAAEPCAAIAGAETVFVGGGNSFRLLKRLSGLKAPGDSSPMRSASPVPRGRCAAMRSAHPTHDLVLWEDATTGELFSGWLQDREKVSATS